MKLAVNRYSLVVKGTKKTAFYYGFKTKKEAVKMKQTMEKVTGVEHEIIDNKRR